MQSSSGADTLTLRLHKVVALRALRPDDSMAGHVNASAVTNRPHHHQAGSMSFGKRLHQAIAVAAGRLPAA